MLAPISAGRSSCTTETIFQYFIVAERPGWLNLSESVVVFMTSYSSSPPELQEAIFGFFRLHGMLF